MNAEALAMVWTFAFIRSDRLAGIDPVWAQPCSRRRQRGHCVANGVAAFARRAGRDPGARISPDWRPSHEHAGRSRCRVAGRRRGIFRAGFRTIPEKPPGSVARGNGDWTCRRNQSRPHWFLAPGLGLFYLAAAWRFGTLTLRNAAGLAGTTALGVMAFTMPHLIRNYSAIGTFILPFPTVWVMFPSVNTVTANTVRLASDLLDTNDLPYPLSMTADLIKREIQRHVLDVRWLNKPESTLMLTYFGFDAGDISERFAWFGVAGYALVVSAVGCVLRAIFALRAPFKEADCLVGTVHAAGRVFCRASYFPALATRVPDSFAPPCCC